MIPGKTPRRENGKIRPAAKADWDALVDVYDASKPDELKAAGLTDIQFVSLRDDAAAKALLRGVEVWVYENEVGRVVGFGGFQEDYIGWLFVHRDWRKQGVGRALLRAMIERCKPPAWLWMLPGNVAAFALYSAEGFKVTDGARINLHGHNVLGLRMVRSAKRTL
jgi:GNAT superfamily N-acetyltransferase